MKLEQITENVSAWAIDLAGLDARVKFDLGTDGIVMVDGKTMPATISNDAKDADCTIRISAENMEKLIAGSLNPTLAYTLGQLKIEGSMGIAIKLASLLDE